MNYVFFLMKAIHLVGAVLWVGGMFFVYVALRPSMAALEPAQRMVLHTQVTRRFFRVVWHAMPLILLTGLTMVFGFLGGLQHQPPAIHAMFGLGILMSLVYLYIFFGPYKRFRLTTDRATMLEALDSIRKLVGVNLILGLITIVVAVIK